MGKRVTNIQTADNPKLPSAFKGKFGIVVPPVPAKTRVTVKDAREKTPASAREGLHKITHGQSRKDKVERVSQNGDRGREEDSVSY
jgi:hypothetical protein